MKELEDYHWFPPFLRNFQTEFIGFVVTTFNFYGVFIRYLKNSNLPKQPMFDLCSGSGEPAITIFKKSDCFDKLILTDKYPQQLVLNDSEIIYLPDHIDVLDLKFQQGTCYTMFNAFHHFTDEEKLNIVNRIHEAGAVGFFVEILQPRIDYLLKVLISTTIGTLLFAPFTKPFSITRLFFTYIVPVNILTITFDGVVSVFKSRSVRQYRKLFLNSQNPVKVFDLKNGLSPIVVIRIQR